jgi:hypothetical protein
MQLKIFVDFPGFSLLNWMAFDNEKSVKITGSPLRQTLKP